MSQHLEFRILGPLEVRDGSGALRLGGPKQRSLLAVLLLHANEVVSGDRLVSEVWGDAPAEDAALHAQVSRLRKVLEPDRDGREPATLLTQPPGYVLRVDPDRLDLLRFDALVEQGHRALEAAEAEQASALLREALALWRGRPLADLEDEPFHREAVQRLDDAWLDALETRVEADLACGRHAGLIAELRTLVRRHPFRERLRGQLMLALYRAGRQAEALEVYAEGRRLMAVELGLEPSRGLQRLQDRILAQDPELDLKPREPPRRPAGGPPSRRRRTLLAAAAATAALAALAAVLVIVLGGDGPDDGRPAVSGGSVTVLDAGTGTRRASVAVGSTPDAIAIGEGATWVVDADEQTVSRIDTATRAVATFATGDTPKDVATGAGAVWVGTGRPTLRSQTAGAVAAEVARVDPATRTVRGRVELPRTRRGIVHGPDGRVAVGAGAAWAVTSDGAVARIDTGTTRVTAVVRGIQARDVAVGAEGVWILGEDGTIARVDPASATVAQSTRLRASAVASLAVGGGAAWVTAPGDGTLWRVDPGRELVVRAIDVGAGAGDVAYGADAVWVANPLRGTVVRVDPARGGVTREVALGGTPRAVAVADGAVWVASSPGTEAARPGTARTGLPSAACGPMVTGAGGPPDRLVVADLPLQGGLRLSAQQVEQAMLHTFRERGFRAGRFRVGFQVCDDSIARTGIFDEAKCAANARTYARTPAVVGLLGYINSPCAQAAVPELNRAPGGPLAALSALATYPGLTRRFPGSPPGELRDLYPTGTRSFLRVNPADDYEGAAQARVAQAEEAGRVAVLDDGEGGFGGVLAESFVTEAERLGLDVALRAGWDPRAAPRFGDLARRVAAVRPQAVFVGGLLDSGGARVVRALRARLGRDVLLLTPSGFTPTPSFAEQAGAAADGAYVSLPGLITESVGPAGRRFAERFGAAQPGINVEPSAVYAAESAAVMLDAIGRSDGSRASVLEELFATRRRNGLLGDLAFDRNGDPRGTPVTILRMKRGARALPDFPGAVLDRVVR